MKAKGFCTLCATHNQNIFYMKLHLLMKVKSPLCMKRYIGAVHILRQRPGGGEGVSQMMTIADEGEKSQKKIKTIGLRVPKMYVKDIS